MIERVQIYANGEELFAKALIRVRTDKHTRYELIASEGLAGDSELPWYFLNEDSGFSPAHENYKELRPEPGFHPIESVYYTGTCRPGSPSLQRALNSRFFKEKSAKEYAQAKKKSKPLKPLKNILYKATCICDYGIDGFTEKKDYLLIDLGEGFYCATDNKGSRREVGRGNFGNFKPAGE